MNIDQALQLIDHAFTANFGGNIPDAYLAPGVYRLWLDTLKAYHDMKRLQVLQARTEMQQNLLLELDGRIQTL